MRVMYESLKDLRRKLVAHNGICYKKPYATRDEAKDFADRYKKNTGTKSYPYICWCGVWHLTTQVPLEEEC